MMSQKDIQDAIAQILKRDCGIKRETISPELRLQEDLGLDSMGLLNLALEVENHFQVYLEEAADNPPESIGDIVNLVMIRLEEQIHAA